MATYNFETRDFGLSETGIHLLRSRFNYKTYPFSEIDSLIVEKGKELKNWLVILIFGIALTSFSIYYSAVLYSVLNDEKTQRIYIEELLIPLIPFLLGLYCLYASTRNVTILRITTKTNKKDKLSLYSIKKENKLDDLIQFLKECAPISFKVNL